MITENVDDDTACPDQRCCNAQSDSHSVCGMRSRPLATLKPFEPVSKADPERSWIESGLLFPRTALALLPSPLFPSNPSLRQNSRQESI